MQNKCYVQEYAKILIFLILTLIILIAKSIFLISAITIFEIIIFIILKKNVKEFVYILKNNFIWLLFFSMVYIMVFRNILMLIYILYKIELIIVLINLFVTNLTFDKLNNGIYTLVFVFKKYGVKVDKVSYGLSTTIFFLIYFFNSNKVLSRRNCVNGRIKHKFIVRLFYSIDKIKTMENNLKLKFYHPRLEKLDYKNIILINLFIILLVFVIFKEVIY